MIRADRLRGQHRMIYMGWCVTHRHDTRASDSAFFHYVVTERDDRENALLRSCGCNGCKVAPVEVSQSLIRDFEMLDALVKQLEHMGVGRDPVVRQAPRIATVQGVAA